MSWYDLACEIYNILNFHKPKIQNSKCSNCILKKATTDMINRDNNIDNTDNNLDNLDILAEQIMKL